MVQIASEGFIAISLIRLWLINFMQITFKSFIFLYSIKKNGELLSILWSFGSFDLFACYTFVQYCIICNGKKSEWCHPGSGEHSKDQSLWYSWKIETVTRIKVILS